MAKKLSTGEMRTWRTLFVSVSIGLLRYLCDC